MILGKEYGLRAVEREDLATLRDWRNLEEFRHCFREHRELNMENQEAWLKRMQGSSNDYMFSIIRLADQKLVGACGILYINWQAKFGDISFYIGDNHTYVNNETLSIEPAYLMFKYAFNELNLNKVWMELYEYDQKKIDFFTKTFGFKIDGKLRQNCFKDGKYHDSYVLSLLANEFSHEKS